MTRKSENGFSWNKDGHPEENVWRAMTRSCRAWSLSWDRKVRMFHIQRVLYQKKKRERDSFSSKDSPRILFCVLRSLLHWDPCSWESSNKLFFILWFSRQVNWGTWSSTSDTTGHRQTRLVTDTKSFLYQELLLCKTSGKTFFSNLYLLFDQWFTSDFSLVANEVSLLTSLSWKSEEVSSSLVCQEEKNRRQESEEETSRRHTIQFPVDASTDVTEWLERKHKTRDTTFDRLILWFSSKT